MPVPLDRLRFIGGIFLGGERGIERFSEQAVAKHLRSRGTPEVFPIHRLMDHARHLRRRGAVARGRIGFGLGSLQRFGYALGENAANGMGGDAFDQSVEIACRQARASGVMHEHPVGFLRAPVQRGERITNGLATL